MRGYPDHPDSEDIRIRRLAEECGLDSWVCAKWVDDICGDLLNEIHSPGGDSHWMKYFKRRLLEHGVQVEFKIVKTLDQIIEEESRG